MVALGSGLIAGLIQYNLHYTPRHLSFDAFRASAMGVFVLNLYSNRDLKEVFHANS